MVIPYVWMEMAHHTLAWGSTFSQWDGSLACGVMEKRDVEWLERKRVSRRSHENNNDRERRSVLRVTPTHLFIDFFRDLGF